MGSLVIGLTAAALAALPLAAHAQAWPAKPIQMISATGTGNPGDVTLRMIVPKISDALGQPILIETRGGASGALAFTAVARAQPDGHTLLFGTSFLVGARFLLKDPPFDVLKDLAPVSFVISSPSVFAVNASLPVNTLSEFVDYARRNPGKLAYVHTGTGLALHLIGESFNLRAGTDLLPVGYKQSGSSMVTDFVSGRVQVYFPGIGTIRPHVESGKVKLLAVVNSSRLRQLPNLPTVDEVLPGFINVTPWFAFLGPAGMPKPIAERFAAETRKALSDPQSASQLDSFGVFAVGSTPDEFASKIRSEIEAIGSLTKTLGIKPE